MGTTKSQKNTRKSETLIRRLDRVVAEYVVWRLHLAAPADRASFEACVDEKNNSVSVLWTARVPRKFFCCSSDDTPSTRQFANVFYPF